MLVVRASGACNDSPPFCAMSWSYDEWQHRGGICAVLPNIGPATQVLLQEELQRSATPHTCRGCTGIVNARRNGLQLLRKLQFVLCACSREGYRRLVTPLHGLHTILGHSACRLVTRKEKRAIANGGDTHLHGLIHLLDWQLRREDVAL